VSDVKFCRSRRYYRLEKYQDAQVERLNETTGEWGIALLRVQANLPDTAPGQNVTVLMFGDAEIIDASQGTTDLAATNVLSTRTAFAPTIDAASTMLAPTQIAANTAQAANIQAQRTRQ